MVVHMRKVVEHGLRSLRVAAETEHERETYQKRKRPQSATLILGETGELSTDGL